MIKRLSLVLSLSALLLCACGKDNPGSKGGGTEADVAITVLSTAASTDYIGNGAQWGGYDYLNQWTGSPTLSQSDWDKLFKRVRFLRPGLVRIMVSYGWNYYLNGGYDPTKSKDVLFPILDFCQAEGIDVITGEWGHEGGTSVDREWLERAINFLDYLVNTKGYTCIKYYNMVNEPNGSWSSTNGNQTLWESLIRQTHELMKAKGLDRKVKLIGPDVAVWNTGYMPWLTGTRDRLGDLVTAYDIHYYPTDEEVHGSFYRQMAGAYFDKVPEGSEMLIGEFGFKYAPTSKLGIENAARIAADPHASDDSNMMIYDAFYGIDIAAAMIRSMEIGYQGVVLWDMDDAMYEKEGKFKRWGFWNIIGEEGIGGAADEKIRPWYYPASLLCRYFPQGCTVQRMKVFPSGLGVSAIAATKGGKYTIAVLNASEEERSIDLGADMQVTLSGAKYYSYTAGTGSSFTGKTDADGLPQPAVTADFGIGPEKVHSLNLPPKTFVLYTNMD